MRKTKTFLISSFVLVLLFGLFCMMNAAHTASAAFTPTVSSVAQTETTVSLLWTKSNDVVFDEYFVASSTSVNGPFNDVAIIADPSQTTFAVTGLTQNTTYYFLVRDKGSDGGNSSTSSSNICEVNTAMNPQLFFVSSTSTTVNLRWTDYNTYTSIMPFCDYAVQMSTNGNQFSTVATINGVNQVSCEVKELSPGASYQFRMYDAVGVSGQYQTTSNTLSASTQSSTSSNSPTSTPEFPSLVVMMLFMIAVLIATLVLAIKKRLS